MVVVERVPLPGLGKGEVNAMNTKTNALRLVMAGVLAAVAGCSTSEAPEKVTLRGAPSQGLSYTREQAEKVTGWLRVKADGAESKQPLLKDEVRVFDDEVLEVDGGRVMKLRRKNVEWTLKRQTPGEAVPVSVPRASVGKTIVLRRTDLGTEYEGGDGIPEDELRANLLGGLEAIVSPPAEPVAPGAEWPIDGERLVDLFGGEEGGRALKIREASGTGRLVSVEAGRLANVRVQLSLLGSFRSLLDVDVKMDLTADLQFDLAAGRPLSFKAHADGVISGEVDRKGKPASYAGEFTFDAKAQNRYR